MSRLPALRPRDVIRALERAGFRVDHQTGSHVILRNDADPPKRVTVAVHSRDLPRGTLSSILREAGLTGEEFRPFL